LRGRLQEWHSALHVMWGLSLYLPSVFLDVHSRTLQQKIRKDSDNVLADGEGKSSMREPRRCNESRSNARRTCQGRWFPPIRPGSAARLPALSGTFLW